MSLEAQARDARRLLQQGAHVEAVRLYMQLCAEDHVVTPAYGEWMQGLARSLAGAENRRGASAVHLYLKQYDQALAMLPAEAHSDRARVLSCQGHPQRAGGLYEEHGQPLRAAIAYERGQHDVEARRCWEASCRLPDLQALTYENALVHFNLGACCLRLGDEEGHTHLMTAQRLLEESADRFETAGQRERAFDCYQILLEMGRRSGAFENLAEGYLNCIRVLKEDNLKFYVLQYYEDFLRPGAAPRGVPRRGLPQPRGGGVLPARGSRLRALLHPGGRGDLAARRPEKEQRQGPPEMSENAYLAAVDSFNTLGDYSMVGQAYHQLGQLGLPEHKQQRYRRIAARYAGAAPLQIDIPNFPEHMRQARAYPEIWYMDLIEWADRGEVDTICSSILADQSYPDLIQRRALLMLLEVFELGPARQPKRQALIAERLGTLQIYAVLSPLERLFSDPDPQIQRGVMLALRSLFFKRSFNLLRAGLESETQAVRQAATDALGRLHFTHAFDPLSRIFRELEDPRIRRTALQSIGSIPSLEAGDFLIEVLRYEPEPLHGQAKQLLKGFQNRDLLPILRQHYQVETGPARAALEEILAAQPG